MDSRDYKTVRKFPFLGDIPVIGEFFKYTTHTRNNQELIILVTPRLVDENDSSTARMSKDMKEFYQKGQQEKASMGKVDLNDNGQPQDEVVSEAPKREHKTVAENEKANSRQVAEEMSQGSILEKYLNRDKLPKK